MITHEETDARRKCFEAWISASPYERSVTRTPNDPANYAWPNQYVDISTQVAWEAWCEASNQISPSLNELAAMVHKLNEKWWQDPATGQPIARNRGELIALMHSELSEALEGERKDLMDDHLPHRRMAEVELADAVIRIMDYCGGFGLDLQGAFEEKLAYNKKRADHTHEARRAAEGKKF